MDTTKILTDLRTQRDHIIAAITALEALNPTAVSHPTAKAATPALKTARTATVAGKRVISAQARQRMALAQQKRWAKKKRAVKAAAKKAAPPAAPA